MGFQTESRTFANRVNAVQNRQVEAFDRIERVEELVRHLMEKMRKLEESIARMEKTAASKSK